MHTNAEHGAARGAELSPRHFIPKVDPVQDRLKIKPSVVIRSWTPRPRTLRALRHGQAEHVRSIYSTWISP